MPDSFTNLTSKQLLRAAALRARIESLENDLAAMLNVSPGKAGAVFTLTATGAPRAKRKVSKAARAKMAAAAKKRWAKAKAAGRNRL